MVFKTINFCLCKWLIPCYIHSLFFSLGYMSSMSKCSFQSFMAPCCSSTFNLSSFLTLLVLSLSYFGPPFSIICLNFHNFHLLFHYLFFLLNNNLFIVFNLILGAFTRDWFTCFIDANVSFLFIAEHFVTIISPELSMLFLNKFFLHPF